MKVDSLGRLVKVDLREVFASEAGEFTPWLAQAENLSLLGEAIAIELELEAQEKDVGPFRADILCKDTSSDDWVLIENQIERTRPHSFRTTADLCCRIAGCNDRLGSGALHR
jgi:hypothetical protein